MSKCFVLDANPFIEAKDRYYGFDICPGFWTSLVDMNNIGRVCSIDRIRAELNEQNDEIKDWIDNRAPAAFFKRTEDQKVIDAFQKMVKWVYSEPFSPPAKAEFASVADGWVAAYAAANKMIVVTHEVYAPGVTRKVPLPNICVEFDIDYVSTFEMLRELGVKFVRSTKRKSKGS